MSKMRICFIAQFPPPMHGLSKAVDTLYNSEINQEFEFEKVDITNNKKILSTLRDISRSKADLFYLTISQTKGGNLRDLVILKLLDMQKKKCLIHLHGGYYRKLLENEMNRVQRRANCKALAKICGAIVLGPSLKFIFTDIIPSEKIYIVPNCIDDELLMDENTVSEKIKKIGLEKIHHVLWLSNFIRSKGYPVVLEMAKIEKERVEKGQERRFHFDFAGLFFDEEEKAYFESFVRENNLEKYVSFHGVVLGEEKKRLLEDCSFFALPTRYPKEGQPISILEAMGNGMVILTTDHAGIPDIVSKDINGYYIKNKEDYLKLYAIESTELLRIAKNNYKKVREYYTQQKYIEKMRNVFIDSMGLTK